MAKKLRVEQIAEIKARGMSPDHRYFVAVNHLRAIRRALDELDDLSIEADHELEDCDELVRGVPVLVTATLESYFRSTVAELIDLGPPFRERASVQKDLRIDIETFLSMEGKRVTLGDLIAHTLSLNSPADLASAYRLVSGGGDLWRDTATTWNAAIGPELFPREPEEIQKQIVLSLADLYRIRHIICHEARTNASVHVDEARSYCERATEFVLTVDYVIDGLIEGAKRDSTG